MVRKVEIYPKRGEVYLVNFDPTIGYEIKKTRPAVVIQNDVSNKHSTVTIVSAITSANSEGRYPNEVFVSKGEGGLDCDSVVLLNQIRTIDKARLIKKLGVFTPKIVENIDKAIEISLGLVKF